MQAVPGDLVLADHADVRVLLRHGVVVRDLAQLPAAEEVGLRVADVHDEQIQADRVGGRERGAHAGERRVGLGAPAHVGGHERR
jgi:hypothetical protein